MGTLIKYELKKLYKSRLNKIVFWGTCLVMFATMLLSVVQTYTYDKEGNKISGLEWVDYKKETIKELEGPLTDERVEELIREYQDMFGNPDNVEDVYGDGNLYFKDEVNYRYYYPKKDLLLLIGRNYDDIEGVSYGRNLVDLSLEERQDFYKARIELFHNVLTAGRRDWKYSSAEQKFWEKKAEELTPPVYYGYAEGWKRVIDCIGYFLFPLMGLCILLARIYAGEYENGAEHIVLTTKYGKTKVIAAKNLAALLFGGLYSFINAGIPYVVILSAFGAEGGKLSIQNYDMQVPYSLTLVQGALLYSGVCLVMAFGIMAFVLFLSARMKSALPVLATSMVMIISGFFLSYSDTNGGYNHIIALLPWPALMTSPLQDITSYPFGNFILDYPSMLYVVYLIFGILLVLFAGRAFRKREVE